MTDNLEQRIKRILPTLDDEARAALFELLGVIDSQREALEGMACIYDTDGDHSESDGVIQRQKAMNVLTLSVPLAGWKEWGV